MIHLRSLQSVSYTHRYRFFVTLTNFITTVIITVVIKFKITRNVYLLQGGVMICDFSGNSFVAQIRSNYCQHSELLLDFQAVLLRIQQKSTIFVHVKSAVFLYVGLTFIWPYGRRRHTFLMFQTTN